MNNVNVVDPTLTSARDASRAPPTARIIYASRTHSQLAQVMKELKRTAYQLRSSLCREFFIVAFDASARRCADQTSPCSARARSSAFTKRSRPRRAPRKTPPVVRSCRAAPVAITATSVRARAKSSRQVVVAPSRLDRQRPTRRCFATSCSTSKISSAKAVISRLLSRLCRRRRAHRRIYIPDVSVLHVART
jgi:hypothetical protein